MVGVDVGVGDRVGVGVSVVVGVNVIVGVGVDVGVGVIVGVDVGKSPTRSMPIFTRALPPFSKYSTTIVYLPVPSCTSAWYV
jgi:hypothetical protein